MSRLSALPDPEPRVISTTARYSNNPTAEQSAMDNFNSDIPPCVTLRNGEKERNFNVEDLLICLLSVSMCTNSSPVHVADQQ